MMYMKMKLNMNLKKNKKMTIRLSKTSNLQISIIKRKKFNRKMNKKNIKNNFQKLLMMKKL